MNQFNEGDKVKVNKLKNLFMVRMVIPPGTRVTATAIRKKLGKVKGIPAIAKVTLTPSTVYRYVVESPRCNILVAHEAAMIKLPSDYSPRRLKTLAEIIEDYPDAKFEDGDLDHNEWPTVLEPQILSMLGTEVKLNEDDCDEQGRQFYEFMLAPVEPIRKLVPHYPVIVSDEEGYHIASTLHSSKEHVEEEYGDRDDYSEVMWLGNEKLFSEEERAKHCYMIPVKKVKPKGSYVHDEDWE